MTSLAQPRILRRRAVENIVGMGRSSIYAAIAAGKFPAPIHLCGRSVGWIATEVDAWVAARIAASRPGQGAPAVQP
jgi:prophage regulatory protein